MNQPGITISGLTKRFGRTTAVDKVSFSVPQGSFLVLLGPSGCGKTTILRMLAGLESPTEGTIRFGDRDVVNVTAGRHEPPKSRDLGLVFQSYAIWPHKTVRQNVEWPLKIAGMDRGERRRLTGETLDLLGIGELADRYPGEISGGQQQRVAIARMIAPRPATLLFDEPLSNLDAKLRVEMRSELLRVHSTTGATSVYVTHDQVEALTMATHIAVLRRGRIEQFGTPIELLESPATPFVARFIGTPPGNIVTAQVRNGQFVVDGVGLGAAGEHTDGDWRQLLYRPEDLTFTATANGPSLEGSVLEITPVAGRHIVACVTVAGRIHAVVDDTQGVAVGDAVRVGLPTKPSADYEAEPEEELEADLKDAM